MRHAIRSATLFLVFLGVCLGLGYASLNRLGTDTGGLSDTRYYRQMVRFEYGDVPAPFRYRVLVPSLAGVMHAMLAPVPLGSWNREALALLTVNATLVGATALLLLEIGRLLNVPDRARMLLPWIYLSTFGVVNAHLVGLVDSAETLFICLAIWICASRRWRWLPAVIGGAGLGKESAFVFTAAFVAIVLLAERRETPWRRQCLLWLTGVAVGGLILVLVHAWVGSGPHAGGAAPSESPASLISRAMPVLGAKSLVYTFLVIGPLGLVRLDSIPRPFLVASVGTGVLAVMAAIAASIGENVARPLFNTIGPALCISSSVFVAELLSRPSED